MSPGLMKAVGEVCAYKKYLRPAELAFTYCSCFERRQWRTTLYPLRQLDGIGMVLSKLLIQSGISTFQDLERTDPRRLETICKKHYPWGNSIKATLSSVPPVVNLAIHFKGRHMLQSGVYQSVGHSLED